MGAGLPNDFQMSALICSRLCHDLVGPVGAVNNGVELLADGDQGIFDEAHALIARSAGQAVRRLRFYRLAFGATRNATVDHRMAMEAAAPMLGDGKIELDWADTMPAQDDARRSVIMKLGLNLILVAADGMPRGGTITFETAGSVAEPAIALAGRGPMATMEASALTALGDGARTDASVVNDLDARGVQPYYAGRLAASLGLAVEVTMNGPEEIRLTCTPR